MVETVWGNPHPALYRVKTNGDNNIVADINLLFEWTGGNNARRDQRSREADGEPSRHCEQPRHGSAGLQHVGQGERSRRRHDAAPLAQELRRAAYAGLPLQEDFQRLQNVEPEMVLSVW